MGTGHGWHRAVDDPVRNGPVDSKEPTMTRKVVTQMAARARARERLHERHAREESDNPVVAVD